MTLGPVILFVIGTVSIYTASVAWAIRAIKRGVSAYSPNMLNAMLVGLGRDIVFSSISNSKRRNEIRERISDYKKPVSDNDLDIFLRFYCRQFWLFVAGELLLATTIAFGVYVAA